MNMSKKPVSVTLDRENLLWLRGRAAALKRRSLSDTLDEIVTAARTGGAKDVTSRSVVGTVDIAEADPGLATADQYIATLFAASVARPFLVRDGSQGAGGKKRRRG
jgi:hypothetical protein